MQIDPQIKKYPQITQINADYSFRLNSYAQIIELFKLMGGSS